MLSPQDLYETDPAVTAWLPGAAPGDDVRRPVLLHHLHGFVDAGQAGGLAVRHLLAELDATEVVRFDADLLVDHRARRPAMVFDADRFTAVTPHEIVVHALRDLDGHPFFVLTGPEPDHLWERFAEAVGQVVDRLGVGLVVGVAAMPWAAPHTRPVALTAHASDRSLIAGRPRWLGRVEVPGHLGALLELRLAGRTGPRPEPLVTGGFTAHVPHYLAAAEFPPAAVALLEAVAEAGALRLPVDRLAEAGAAVLLDVDEQVRASSETTEAVGGLERSYDAAAAGRTLGGPGLPTPTLPEDELAGGDELAAELEAFLRSNEDRTPD